MRVRTEEELAKAIENGEDTIEIEGDLKEKTLKIKATGKVAWIIAIGAIGVAVTIVIATGGTGAPASGIIGVGAVSVLGLPAAISAVSIAVAAGGVGVLNKLRNYRIVKNNDNILILKK
jgi:hypothetical protein